MIIIGVDPGTLQTGYGIIRFEKNSFVHLDSGVISLKSLPSLPEKLEKIYDELSVVMDRWKPDEFAIETAFYGKNVQSALKIGYARGVALLSAVHKGIIISEYAPREIKKAVVGNGAASKEQIAFMVGKFLDVRWKKSEFDKTDALGVALCHAFRCTNPAASARDWKSFAEANPGRIIK